MAAKKTDGCRKVINAKTVAAAISDATLSAYGVEAKETRHADLACPGLVIRVRKRTAVWTLEARRPGGKASTWRVAAVRPGDDPDVMRARVKAARELLMRGIDPAAYFKAEETGIRPREASGGLTWAEAVEKFLEHVKESRSVHTWKDYGWKLNGPHFPKEEWSSRMLKDVTALDIMAMRDAIADKGLHSLSRHTLRVAKSMLSWAVNRSGTGIAGTLSVAAGIKPVDSGEGELAGREPLADELGEMPWKIDAVPAQPGARYGAVLILLTAQRRETVMTAKRADFVVENGETLWRIPPLATKKKRRPGERGHVLPLVPLAAAVVRAALAAAVATDTASPWLFPQTRRRMAADAGGGHMAAAAPGRLMLDAAVGFSPHDVRRAFAAWAEDVAGFADLEVKAVLDHSEGKAGDVTDRHYARSKRLHIKRPLLAAWTEHVLAQARRRRPEGRTDDLPACLSLPDAG